MHPRQHREPHHDQQRAGREDASDVRAMTMWQAADELCRPSDHVGNDFDREDVAEYVDCDPAVAGSIHPVRVVEKYPDSLESAVEKVAPAQTATIIAALQRRLHVGGPSLRCTAGCPRCQLCSTAQSDYGLRSSPKPAVPSAPRTIHVEMGEWLIHFLTEHPDGGTFDHGIWARGNAAHSHSIVVDRLGMRDVVFEDCRPPPLRPARESQCFPSSRRHMRLRSR